MIHRPGCESPSQQSISFFWSNCQGPALLWYLYLRARGAEPRETTLVPFKPSENLIYVLRAYFPWVNLRSAFHADIFANPGEKGKIVKGSKECKPLDLQEQIGRGPVMGRVSRSSAFCLSASQSVSLSVSLSVCAGGNTQTTSSLRHDALCNLLNSWRLDLFSKVCAQREPLRSYKL